MVDQRFRKRQKTVAKDRTRQWSAVPHNGLPLPVDSTSPHEAPGEAPLARQRVAIVCSQRRPVPRILHGFAMAPGLQEEPALLVRAKEGKGSLATAARHLHRAVYRSRPQKDSVEPSVTARATHALGSWWPPLPQQIARALHRASFSQPAALRLQRAAAHRLPDASGVVFLSRAHTARTLGILPDAPGITASAVADGSIVADDLGDRVDVRGGEGDVVEGLFGTEESSGERELGNKRVDETKLTDESVAHLDGAEHVGRERDIVEVVEVDCIAFGGGCGHVDGANEILVIREGIVEQPHHGSDVRVLAPNAD